MQRTDYTQEELAKMDEWLKDQGFVESQENKAKLEQIALWFDQNPNVAITAKNFISVVEQRSGEFTWLSAAQQSFSKLRLSESDKQLILDFVQRRSLKSEDDDLWINASILGEYLQTSRLPVAASLDIALQRIQNTPKGQHLRWGKQKLQDSEKEARRIKQEQAARRQWKNDDIEIPSYVPGHLRQHWRSLHANSKPASTPESTTMCHFEKLSRDAVASITSTVDRAEAERLLSKAGAWSWELVHRSVMNFIESRKHERAFAGQ